ncbi:MAG TPA: hypothetical protein VGQ83_10375 [Polyangia bacterium]
MAGRDPAWPREPAPEEDEGVRSVVGSLAAFAETDLPVPPSWWRRRQLERTLETELRVLGLRVALNEGSAVLLEPTLRRQAAQVRATWQELHPGAAPPATPAATTDLLASVEEMRRRLGELARLVEARAPRPRAEPRPASVALSGRGERRAARRR